MTTFSIIGSNAFASDVRDAAQFHELLRSSLPATMNSSAKLPFVHVLPDQDVLAASDADSIESAINLVKRSSLAKLAKETEQTPANPNLINGPYNNRSADELLASRPITIVIVPGIFGEFIPTRGFEEVLKQPSVEREAFAAQTAAAIKANNPNATDRSFDIRELKEKPLPLNDLVNVGSLKGKSGKTIARVALFYTPFMSLESMGSLDGHAAMFNRRLAKYLALTGPQDLVFVGYSRGTDLGLEMLAQAEAKKESWLSSVKAMISLGGVAWGSTLADDSEISQSTMGKVVQEVKNLRKGLDPESPISTLNAWAQFSIAMTAMTLLAPDLVKHPNAPTSSDLQASPISSGTDPNSLFTMVSSLFTTLGLSNPIGDFSNNVKRFQALIDAVLDGTGQLTTRARVQWWTTHTLPKQVKYYSITAAMASPESNEFDRTAFDTKIGYAKTYDDLSLLQNRLDYEALSGISLNDSQVSVAQAMILPAAAAKLNPANAGMKSAFLGSVGTHHWGLALQTVNAMKDGRMNPFPREALLKSLGAKVILDLSLDLSLDLEDSR